MSYYGRHISGLWLSTTADYAENELSPAPTETFTATKVIDEARRHVASGTPNAYLLTAWTTIKRVEMENLAESTDELYFNFTNPDDPNYVSYLTLEPGDSCILSNLYPASLIDATAASLLVQGGGSSYYRLIALGT